MALPLAAISVGTGVVNAGANLANLYSQNQFNREMMRQKKREYEDQMREYQEQKNERLGEKNRLMERQRLADLFDNASWLGDKDKERLEQNYGFYVKNLMGGR